MKRAAMLHTAGGWRRVRLPRVAVALGVVLGGALAACAAGVVITRSERLVGELSVKGGSLCVDGTAVAWDEVAVVINDKVDGRAGQNAIGFKNGEVWTGVIESLQDGVVEITNPMLGKRTVAVANLRTMDFQPGLPRVAQPETNVLHRLRGKPSPGVLLAVDRKRVSAETVLGTLSFDRDKIERYVFDTTAAAVAKTGGSYDAVALADGTVLHGTVEPRDAALVLDHAEAGEKPMAGNGWVWICRYGKGLLHLADKDPAAVRTFPLIQRPADPPRVEDGPLTRGDDRSLFVRRVHLQPRTIITYRAGGGEFSAALAMDRGARGPAVVRFRAGNKLLKEHVLSAGGKNQLVVRFPVEAGSELSVEVDFEKTPVFPCGVVMDDPVLALKP